MKKVTGRPSIMFCNTGEKEIQGFQASRSCEASNDAVLGPTSSVHKCEECSGKKGKEVGVGAIEPTPTGSKC